jgi:hypothetical protein
VLEVPVHCGRNPNDGPIVVDSGSGLEQVVSPDAWWKSPSPPALEKGRPSRIVPRVLNRQAETREG